MHLAWEKIWGRMQEVCDGGPGKTLSGYTHGNLGKDYMELTAAAVATVGYGAEEM